MNMPECVWIYNNRQGSKCELTPQVYEYLLRDRHIQNRIKDLRWSAVEKEL